MSDIEITNGTERIVEVVLNDVHRGYVCDDDWDDNDATVACRMLGFAKGLAIFGETTDVNDSLPILLDNVRCSGEELSLAHCRHNDWGSHNYKYSELASVKCFNDSFTDNAALSKKLNCDIGGRYVKNDIALLKVKSVKGMKFNDYIQPACLPKEDDLLPSGTTCNISGWGLERESGTISRKLRVVEVNIIPEKACKSLFDGYRIDFENLICAGDANGGKDTCQGDSGGPLICKTSNYSTVIGITSLGIGCGRAKLPGVYTNVSVFIRWIAEQILHHRLSEKRAFLDPALQNVDFGTVAVKPDLEFKRELINNREHSIPQLIFICQFNNQGGLFYTVIWYIDENCFYETMGPSTNMEDLMLHEKQLISNNISLGIYVRCGVRSSMSVNGTLTSVKMSGKFYAGIKVFKKVKLSKECSVIHS